MADKSNAELDAEAEAKHRALMRDVQKNQEEANRLLIQSGYMAPSAVHSDGKPLIDPRISNDHKSPL